MSRLLGKLWSDDVGGMLASEFLFMYTMLIVGSLSGLTAMRQALVTEMVESANALLALDQSYSFSGRSNALSWSAGSGAIDHTNHISAGAATPTQVPCE